MTARLSNLLLEHRKASKLSQAEMASLLNISQQAYGKLERGALPREPTMKLIAEVTKIGPAELTAARTAQYEWNNGLSTSEVVADGPVGGQEDVALKDGLELLHKISGALASGELRRQHIAALSMVVDSYLAEGR